MGKNVLQMKYHAAKKEVSFRRFQDGEEIAINAGGALSKYVNMKGKFVLQDFGNTFFRDIAKVFDGIKNVEIEAIMSKLDYEDLVQMIENYNQDPSRECTYRVTLLAELPDMKKTFEEVKKYGEKAVGILGSHRSKLFDLPLDNENVKKSVESFAKQIDAEINNIKSKIDSLSDNRVNLCFTGVYSAGKSALINALLGYKILPESIESKTAKMIHLYSPALGEKVKIIFDICGVYTVLAWNDNDSCFEINNGPTENPIRMEIQLLLNDIKEQGKRQDEQVRSIIDKLNDYELISSEIRIEFPVPLDRENVQFSIYDTPGTDSNYAAHQQVLAEALENQTQSILIFVAKPDSLEGTGNNTLLSYLKDVELKNTKTSIDISRSLFVINKADTLTDAEFRKKLQHGIIKSEDSDFSIKLEDKKLFFTSAYYGYVSKAIKNEISTSQEKYALKKGVLDLTDEESPVSYSYRDNRSASSEYATNVMIEKCEEELVRAREKNEEAEIVYICSGLFALEQEIIQYGEKYAAAVKAFAIIDSVDKALAKLTNQASSLRECNQEEISAIERNIGELQKTINETIESEYLKRSIKSGEAVSDEVRKKLKIDSSSLAHSLTNNAKAKIDKILKGGFLGKGKVKTKETHILVIKNEITKIITDFTNQFMKDRELLLSEERDAFMNEVKIAINENGNISEAAKKYFQDIPKPDINKSRDIVNLDDIYNSNKRTEKFLFFKEKEIIDKESFVNELDENFRTVALEMAKEYAGDYQKALETVLMAIKNNFEDNLAQYSLDMKNMIDNRDVMVKLGEKITNAAEDLVECENKINAIIWKEA